MPCILLCLKDSRGGWLPDDGVSDLAGVCFVVSVAAGPETGLAAADTDCGV
jgi:hypothetical protein